MILQAYISTVIYKNKLLNPFAKNLKSHSMPTATVPFDRPYVTDY